MIVPMKHVTIVATANRLRRTLIRLREMGMLHMQRIHQSAEVSSKIHTRFLACQRALQIMRQYRKIRIGRMRIQQRRTRIRERGIFPGEEIAHTVVRTLQRLEALREEEQRIAHYSVDLRVWGGFKWSSIERLQESGLYCHFYSITRKVFARNAPAHAMVVARQRGRVYFVVFSRTEDNELPYEESTPPRHDLEQLQRRQYHIGEEQRKIDTQLGRLAWLSHRVWTAYQRLYELNQIIHARTAFGWANKVAFARGFVPANQIAELKRNATEMRWGLLIRDPYPEEEPPTMMQNPKSIAIITPLYRMLGTLPGYREPEISALFLLFFALFFAMIIGDAGYALLLIGFALCYRLCARSVAHKQGAGLLMVVGIATLVWGGASGNWFGAEQIAARPFFARFVVPQLNAFDTRSIPFVQWICFLIAAVHVSTAHVWRTVYQWKHGYWVQACANIGWIFLILGLYSLVVRLIVGAFGYWYIGNIFPLLIAGVAGIVLFEQQKRGVSFFIGVAKGLAGLFNTLLNSISAFADIISYLRLFAVGLASVEIARSFNQIALNIEGGFIATVIAVSLLFLGHSLNLAMGALSIIVHGVRLNMLEFSSHLGVEWSGIAYQPFSRQTVR